MSVTSQDYSPSSPEPEEELNDNIVKVRNTDFNGYTFDGCPFSSTPDWLRAAVKDQRIKISDCSGSTDYAVFDVQCADRTVRALPSDKIELLSDGSLKVHEYPEKYRHPSRLPA